MNNNNLVLFKKMWYDKENIYKEKLYWFNPFFDVKGIEACNVRNAKGETVECTKVYYGDYFITLVVNIEDFFTICRKANAAFALINDLYKEGITIRDFINQNERLNGIELG